VKTVGYVDTLLSALKAGKYSKNGGVLIRLQGYA
jgi:hypothetical protein